MPGGSLTTRSPFAAASRSRAPPEVTATAVQPCALACLYISMVSTVSPE